VNQVETALAASGDEWPKVVQGIVHKFAKSIKQLDITVITMLLHWWGSQCQAGRNLRSCWEAADFVTANINSG
jgi:hypothetical protein